MEPVSPAKNVRDLAALLSTLSEALDRYRVSEATHVQSLTRLKELSRFPHCAKKLCDERSIRTLAKAGLTAEYGEVSREALKCIANVLFQERSARQIVVDLDLVKPLAERFGSGRYDDEFLCARILFLLTYETSLDLSELCETSPLAANLEKCLNKQARRCTESDETGSKGQASEADMALTETLKLLFNITHNDSQIASRFTLCVPSITSILRSRSQKPHPTPILQAPLTQLINALLNLHLSDNANSGFFPSQNPVSNVQTLIKILDESTSQDNLDYLERFMEPVLMLIRRVFEIAPDDVRQSMQYLLLPGQAERDQPLGKSETLSSRLLRLSTSAHTSRIRESLARFFFELSNSDPSQFVHNVGYGYASGFLASNKIPVPPPQRPENGTEDNGDVSANQHSNSSTAQSNSTQHGINFVTGQFLDRETPDQQAPMTEDEKLREAEKLFVLFERLKQTGVIDVQNPLQAAVESGRFEELE